MAMTSFMSSRMSTVLRFNINNSQRFQIHNLFYPISNLGMPKQTTGSSFLSTQRSNLFSTIKNNKRDLSVYNGVVPDGSGAPSNSIGWLIGLAMAIILPFFTNKWGPLLKWTKEIETMVENVENITNTVESAAGKIHQVAESIEESLPQGKLRQTFDLIENTAEEIAHRADLAGDLIDKIQEVEDKVEALLEENEVLKEKVATATDEVAAVSVKVAELETQAELPVEHIEVVKVVGNDEQNPKI